MGGHRCSVAGCDNDKRRPKEIREIRKGLANFEWGQETRVCCNHFQEGKPTRENPYPTLFLCPRDFATPSPKKRRTVTRGIFATTDKKPTLAGKQFTKHISACQVDQSTQANLYLHVALQFQHIQREGCVRVLTGLPSPEIFKKIFSWIEVKAKRMQYWKGEKITLASVAYTHQVNSEARYGPSTDSSCF